MIDVWARRQNSETAQALVERIRAEGGTARECYAPLFRASEIGRDVTAAYHDGSHRGIPAAYKALGLPCKLMDGMEPSRVEDMEVSDYEVVQRGQWFSVVGPKGKVGKSVRDEAEAIEILEAARASGD